jgi:hypothetical protein
VGVVKRWVLRGLWRRLVGVGFIGPGLLACQPREETPDREGQGDGRPQVGRALGFCHCTPDVLSPGSFLDPY